MNVSPIIITYSANQLAVSSFVDDTCVFFCFVLVVIMSETSHHQHCELDMATLKNKGELHLLSYQIFNYFSEEKF